MSWIIISGNVVDGLEFFGPFDDATYAGDWAEDEARLDDWWVAPLVVHDERF